MSVGVTRSAHLSPDLSLPAEMTVQERCDLGTPLRLFGHGRQELELEHEPWHLQSDSPVEDIPGHLIVVPANLSPVGRDDVNDRQREADVQILRG